MYLCGDNMSEKKRIPTLIRILFFTVGIILLSALLIYGVSWDSNIVEFSMLGIIINRWAVAAGMVLLGLLGGAMVRSALIGSYGID